jgi:subtilisin family serine protease
MLQRSFFVISSLFIFSFINAQDVPKGWHLLDFKSDTYYGISLNKAYKLLQDKRIKSIPVIVGVMDSGIDTLHEDLKNILWHNPKEIPNNGIDDDRNGYVDDIYGWNFLGNKNGENLKKVTDEKTRIYYKFKEKFGGKKISIDSLPSTDLKEYSLWKRAAMEMNISTEDETELAFIELLSKALKRYNTVIVKEMEVEEFTAQQLEKFESKTTVGKQSKYNYLTTIKLLEIDLDEKNTAILTQLDEYINQKKTAIAAIENAPPNYRFEVIKDDYYNIHDQFYGNPDVKATFPNHGTHVSGIIAAQRNNKLGMDGIADNAKIMMLRVVPDGDEYDKDIALAIFYAVNKGAKVINMSFGKGFSPEKYWIDSAVKYAAIKDVLIIHAAGNDSKNVDTMPSFPTAYFLDSKEKALNFMTVGASTDPKISNGDFIASFSNYGKQSVDVFAPGVKIYATLPNENNYGNQQGTSMAAPVVTGIAALLRSYFPSLTAVQTKEIIEATVVKPNIEEVVTVTVGKKNNEEKLTLKDACKTSGIVNAANAVELAFKIDAANKKKLLKAK